MDSRCEVLGDAARLAGEFVDTLPSRRLGLRLVAEFSRRARGIPVYAALRALGRRGVAELIDRCCDHAGWQTAADDIDRSAEAILRAARCH